MFFNFLNLFKIEMGSLNPLQLERYNGLTKVSSVDAKRLTELPH
jgi:hypothetical protein